MGGAEEAVLTYVVMYLVAIGCLLVGVVIGAIVAAWMLSGEPDHKTWPTDHKR